MIRAPGHTYFGPSGSGLELNSRFHGPRLSAMPPGMPTGAFHPRFGSKLIILRIFSPGPWVFTAGRSGQKERILPRGQFTGRWCDLPYVPVRSEPASPSTAVKRRLTWGCVPDLTPAPQALLYYSFGAVGTHHTHFLLNEFLALRSLRIGWGPTEMEK